MKSKIRFGFLLLLIPMLAACSSGVGANTDAGIQGCDPFAPDPVSLGTVIGVGQDANGKLYVDTSTGIFIADHGPLMRQVVAGSGQSGNNEFTFSLSIEDGGTTSLLVETNGATADKMALGPPDSRVFLDQSPTGTTPLAVVANETIGGLRVRNVPYAVSYVADVEGGDVLVVTQSKIVDSPSPIGQQRLFFGPPSAVRQREIVTFSQSRSGAILTFKLDGLTASYRLGFNPPFGGPGNGVEIAGFSDGQADRNADMRTSTSLDGLNLTCF